VNKEVGLLRKNNNSIIMFTECKEVIQRGVNKGKLCGEVNSRCHHIIKVCKLCYKHFKRDTTYIRHASICKAVPPGKVKLRPVIRPIVKSSPVPQPQPQPQPQLCSKETSDDILKRLENEVNDLKELKAVLQQALNSINTVNITNNTTYNQIVISDVGAFKLLCDKMGSNEATNFLCTLANKPKTMVLFEKVYLDCERDQYPIANANGKDFYYRDTDNNIICDEGGYHISKLGDRLIKNAFIEASDPLLTRFVSHNAGDREGDDDDYSRFRELQNAACSLKTDKTFIKELSLKTYCPDHMFFT
jgi:hypothetical protein